MWLGPYGEWGSRKYLLASLDQSLRRMGLDYVDIFYSHRFDPETPLEETMGALDTAARQGKALYVGISSYSAAKTAEAYAILRELGAPFVIHQPSYSMLNRWIEGGAPDTLGELGIGCILLAARPGDAHRQVPRRNPRGSRATRDGTLSPELITDEALEKIRALNEIAAARGSDLAQLALAWTLRDPASPRRSSERAASRSSRRTSPPSTVWTSPTTNCPRSIALPATAASISGRLRAANSPVQS